MADPSPLSNKLQPGDVQSRVNPQTGVKEYQQWNGKAWNDIPPPVGRRVGSSVNAITPAEEAALAKRREQADAAQQLAEGNNRAIPASNALNSGPYRGMLLDAALPNPDNKGGWADAAGAMLIGGPARLFGAVTAKDAENYKTVKRAENEAVSAKQLPQKGAQTESDAARYAMTGVSVGNTPAGNRTVAAQDTQANQYLQAKRRFEVQWANQYGLSGINEKGDDMTTAFQKQFFKPPSQNRPSGTVIIPRGRP